MAATSASRSWAAFARRAVITGAVATVGLIGLAIPASAHTPWAKADCNDNKIPTVWVKASSYELKKDDATPNTVEIFVDGADKAEWTQKFGVNLDKTEVPFDKIDATVAHKFLVVITAWNDKTYTTGKDDPNWSQKIPTETKACKEKETTPPPPPNNPPNNPPANPAPQPQPAPAPAVSSGGLADTGVSIAVPLAGGALLLVAGGALLLLMRRRGRA